MLQLSSKWPNWFFHSVQRFPKKIGKKCFLTIAHRKWTDGNWRNYWERSKRHTWRRKSSVCWSSIRSIPLRQNTKIWIIWQKKKWREKKITKWLNCRRTKENKLHNIKISWRELWVLMKFSRVLDKLRSIRCTTALRTFSKNFSASPKPVCMLLTSIITHILNI